MSSEDTSTAYYISIISGMLLTISEILPYISKIKGNGIIEVLLNSCSKYEQEKQSQNRQILDRIKTLEQQLEQLRAHRTG